MPPTLPIARTSSPFHLNPTSLLVSAAILHVLITLGIYTLAHSSVLVSTFDTNGIAVSFAPDGIKYREEAARLSDVLAGGQLRAWLLARSPFHVKLYSISFAILGPLFGDNILSAEPLNLFFYLTVLVLIFYLGLEVLDRRAGLTAAAIVAVWPSFLLHSTQPLKDPAFIAAMLAFVLINLRLLSRSYSRLQALLAGTAGGLVAIFICLVRYNQAELLIATTLLAATMLTAQQLSQKRFRATNCLGIALLIIFSVGVTQAMPKFKADEQLTNSPRRHKLVLQKRAGSESLNPVSRIAARIGTLRERFTLEYPDAASNLDGHVQLDGVGDLISYFPRAAVVGFFAPFPNMWFDRGQHVGFAGRLISGFETSAMYVIEGLAIVCLFGAKRGSRRFSVWLLASIAAVGMLLLGLIAVNVGALYRLRYVFLFLLIVLAAGGVTQLLERLKKASVQL